jgi:hypothetical protein
MMGQKDEVLCNPEMGLKLKLWLRRGTHDPGVTICPFFSYGVRSVPAIPIQADSNSPTGSSGGRRCSRSASANCTFRLTSVVCVCRFDLIANTVDGLSAQW